jgi:hypothetical protein
MAWVRDHPGQPNAPGRQAFSQLGKRELDVPDLQVSEPDCAGEPGQAPGRAGEPGQVPDRDPVAGYGGFCLRIDRGAVMYLGRIVEIQVSANTRWWGSPDRRPEW